MGRYSPMEAASERVWEVMQRDRIHILTLKESDIAANVAVKTFAVNSNTSEKMTDYLIEEIKNLKDVNNRKEIKRIIEILILSGVPDK